MILLIRPLGLLELVSSVSLSNAWVWPFTTRAISQEKRIDQGWDLQGIPGAPILAVSSGTVGMSRPDPAGFGPDYPYLVLDNPPAGAPSDTVYYGHTDILPGIAGKHVSAGDVIGRTAPGGHNSPPGWLEIGFAQHGSGAPIGQAGAAMKNILNGAATGPSFGQGGGMSLGASGAPVNLISASVPSTTVPCAVSIPLFGCLLSKSQFRAVGGGVIIFSGIAVAALGVWLIAGHPGTQEAGMIGKLAVLA